MTPPNSKTNIKNLKDTLRRGTEVLDKLKVPYLLVGGTLLGIIREGNLLGHDPDVDVDILAEDVGDPKKFLKKLNSVSDIEFGFHNQYFTAHCVYPNQTVSFDIFIVFKKKGKRFRHFWSEDSDNFNDAPCLVWPEKFYKKEWAQVLFEGKCYNVPGDPEKYLEVMYGKDWRTPIKAWSWPNSASNNIAYKDIWKK